MVNFNSWVALKKGFQFQNIFKEIFKSNNMFKLNYFQQVDSWNFDMFTFSRAAKGSPLKYLGE